MQKSATIVVLPARRDSGSSSSDQEICSVMSLDAVFNNLSLFSFTTTACILLNIHIDVHPDEWNGAN